MARAIRACACVSARAQVPRRNSELHPYSGAAAERSRSTKRATQISADASTELAQPCSCKAGQLNASVRVWATARMRERCAQT